MVNWVQTSELIASLLPLWEPQSDRRPTVVGVGGFPFAGKTTFVAQFIEAIRPLRGVSLPVEAFILSRHDRNIIKTNGCAPEAYKIGELKAAILSLRSNQSVEVNEYSWELGHLTDKVIKIENLAGGYLFVDGTVTIINELAQLMDHVCVFVPEKRQVWRKQAIERDSNERNWERSDAEEQNMLKERETDRLLKEFQGNVTYTIEFSLNANREFIYHLDNI